MKTVQYTKGPDRVAIGGVWFERGKPKSVSDDIAAAATRSTTVREYGFEIVHSKPTRSAARKSAGGKQQSEVSSND